MNRNQKYRPSHYHTQRYPKYIPKNPNAAKKTQSVSTSRNPAGEGLRDAPQLLWGSNPSLHPSSGSCPPDNSSVGPPLLLDLVAVQVGAFVQVGLLHPIIRIQLEPLQSSKATHQTSYLEPSRGFDFFAVVVVVVVPGGRGGGSAAMKRNLLFVKVREIAS